MPDFLHFTLGPRGVSTLPPTPPPLTAVCPFRRPYPKALCERSGRLGPLPQPERPLPCLAAFTGSVARQQACTANGQMCFHPSSAIYKKPAPDCLPALRSCH